MKQSFLDISSLNKTYATRRGSIHALEDIQLSVETNEFTAIVGPSGCGKTTLLKIIAGLVEPTSGSVSVDGREVQGPSADTGIAFQTSLLLPWRSVLDNVLLPIDMSGRDRSRFRDRALALLEVVGLSEFATRHPYELSGGMQQRASIARSLISDPRLLLLDEPFGALDALLREQLNVELQRIWMSDPKTVLLITHSINEAVFLADRVVTMSPRPGRISSVVDVNIPRPRELSVMSSPEFAGIAGQIREQMNRDARVAAESGHE